MISDRSWLMSAENANVSTSADMLAGGGFEKPFRETRRDSESSSGGIAHGESELTVRFGKTRVVECSSVMRLGSSRAPRPPCSARTSTQPQSARNLSAGSAAVEGASVGAESPFRRLRRLPSPSRGGAVRLVSARAWWRTRGAVEGAPLPDPEPDSKNHSRTRTATRQPRMTTWHAIAVPTGMAGLSSAWCMQRAGTCRTPRGAGSESPTRAMMGRAPSPASHGTGGDERDIERRRARRRRRARSSRRTLGTVGCLGRSRALWDAAARRPASAST
mmetsp:Transcript_24164/g.82614  ORF Transcript_24164/g.82614 Transcript_24164/m.82614 type:complete len:275 (-) Transcript_24164:38-862(-)